MQMDLTDIYRTFHPNTKEYIFSAPHGTFSKIDHIVTKRDIVKHLNIHFFLLIVSYSWNGTPKIFLRSRGIDVSNTEISTLLEFLQ